MENLGQAIELLDECHRLWEEKRLSEALTLIETACTLVPDFPDPWIDVAGLLRAMNHKHEDEKLEMRAIEADRKLIDLANEEPDLIVELTLAKKRVSHREAWKKHLQGAYEKTIQDEKELSERSEKAEAETERLKIAHLEILKGEVQQKMNEVEARADKAWKFANKEWWKTLSRKEKRLAKTGDPMFRGPDSSFAYAVLAQAETDRLSRLMDEMAELINRQRFIKPTVYVQPTLLNSYQIQQILQSFYSSLKTNKCCPHCGVSLEQMPPSA